LHDKGLAFLKKNNYGPASSWGSDQRISATYGNRFSFRLTLGAYTSKTPQNVLFDARLKGLFMSKENRR
jgi:hypothetical protein